MCLGGGQIILVAVHVHAAPLIREFLYPLEQTATLCGMSFPAPYVLYSSLKAATDGTAEPHAEGYARLLEAIRDDRFDFAAAGNQHVIHHDTIPVTE